jgi:hypothetical protein
MLYHELQTVIGEHTILGRQRPEAVLTSYIVPPAKVTATAAADTTAATNANIAAAVAAAANSSDSDSNEYGIPQFEDILASPYVENRHPEVVVTSEANCRQEAVETNGSLTVNLPLGPLPLTPTMPWLNGRPTAGEQSSEETSAGGGADDDESVAGTNYELLMYTTVLHVIAFEYSVRVVERWLRMVHTY